MIRSHSIKIINLCDVCAFAVQGPVIHNSQFTIKPIKQRKSIKLVKLTKPIVLISMLLMLASVGKARADEFEVALTAGLREEYNSNIFFSADDGVDDLVTTVAAGLTASDRTETLSWFLKAEAAPFFYLDFDELNDVDQDYQGGGDYQLSPRWRVNADAGFRVDNRPDRESEETGQVFNNQRRHRTTADLGTGYALSEVQHLSVSYAYEADNWQEDVTSNVDYKGHSLNLGASRDVSRWVGSSTLSGNLGLQHYAYETADIDTAFASLGLVHMLSEVYRFQATLGARYTETRYEQAVLVLVPPGVFDIQYEDKKTETWGGLGSLDLTYLGERSQLSLSLYHDLRPAQGTSGPSNLTRARLDLSRRLRERMRLGLACSYFLNRAEANEYFTVPEDKETFSLRPRIWWAFSQRLTLAGAYAYTYVADHEDDTHSQRHLVYAELTYVWPFIGGR